MKMSGPFCNIAESSGMVPAERQTSEDPSAGPAQLLRAHGRKPALLETDIE